MGQLVLTRRPGESILIGDDIKVTFIERKGTAARIAIEAPQSVRVRRGELSQPGIPARENAGECEDRQ